MADGPGGTTGATAPPPVPPTTTTTLPHSAAAATATATTNATTVPGSEHEIGVDEESVASLTILLMLLLLLASTVVGYQLRSRNVYWLSEAGTALLFGVFASLIVEVAAAAKESATKGSWVCQYSLGRSAPPGHGVLRLVGMWVCSVTQMDS